MSSNSEAGCEQSNSTYSKAKDKYSNRTNIQTIQARVRESTNGPPVHLFKTKSVKNYWINHGHKYADVNMDKEKESSAITRTRKDNSKKYTCKIFV